MNTETGGVVLFLIAVLWIRLEYALFAIKWDADDASTTLHKRINNFEHLVKGLREDNADIKRAYNDKIESLQAVVNNLEDAVFDEDEEEEYIEVEPSSPGTVD